MRIVMFYHSIVSDWNQGNAHFLRGIVTELLEGTKYCEPDPGAFLHDDLEPGRISVGNKCGQRL